MVLVIQLLIAGQSLMGQGPEPYSSARTDRIVIDAWMRMQIRLMAGTQSNFNGPFIRIYAYSGLIAYATIEPDIARKSPFFFDLGKLNEFPVMPGRVPGKYYYNPAALNASLALINRLMFPMANPANRAAMDSLERSLFQSFLSHMDTAAMNRSAAYGVSVALQIYRWAESDGYRNANDGYLPPGGRGSWKPTAPAYSTAASPYWGQIRPIFPGSSDGAEPPPPPAYDEDTSSVFYKMVREVYDLSRNLTKEQGETAVFWRDVNPGVSAPGHWLNILRKAMLEDESPMEKALFAYAVSGMALHDTWINSWKVRYTYNVQRPITYIQNVMGHTDWKPVIPTPPHPEYPGGHAALSSTIAEVLAFVFGSERPVVDDTYQSFGLGTRRYSSFQSMADEAAISKVYAGIHYTYSVDMGLRQGRKIAGNIIGLLKPTEGSKSTVHKN